MIMDPKLARLLEMRLAEVDDRDGRLDVAIMKELGLSVEEYVALDHELSKMIATLKVVVEDEMPSNYDDHGAS